MKIRRLMVFVATLLVASSLLAGIASADPFDKLFGCDGYVKISCPGPLPW